MSAASDVAKNLRAIEDMAARLEARAIDRANSRDGIVGGDAMVAMAGVGSIRDWTRRVEIAEAKHEREPWRYAELDISTEDPDQFWPALQILWWWTEDYRQQLNMDYDDPRWRATLASETGFLRNKDVADWIWDHEVKYDDFAKDVERAKDKLESILVEGQRTLQGVPCMYDECKGRRLQRKLRPKYEKAKGDEEPKRVRDARGNGLWDFEDWTCPKCKRTWTEDAYAAHITAAHERAKVEDIDGQTWCTADYAARKVDRSVKTVRTWINREELVTLCMIAGRRLPFVNLEDVRELAQGRARRKSRVA